MSLEQKTCWIVTEGLAGTENQCIGVAEALGVDYELKRIQLKQPWKLLSPPLLTGLSSSFYPPLSPPWPDILIASGRKSVLVSLFIKKRSKGRTFIVQLQDPKISPQHFDLVAAPYHDSIRGDNVIVTDGAPNKVTEKRLEEGQRKFAEILKNLPSPRVAVLIGGNSRAYAMTQEDTKKLAGQLKDLSEKTGAGLMITASRRTGEKNKQILKQTLSGPDIYFWDGDGENPYFGFLGWADVILVSEDSVSMMSEAATTGKPVYKVPLTLKSKRKARRLLKFHDHLKKLNVIRDFKGDLSLWQNSKLEDSDKIALAIEAALRLKNQNRTAL